MSQQAERIGAESVWLFDHFHTVPRPTDEITFESFTSLSALAALTDRVRLGHIVICNGFRNPALTAKMASTLDTISGGRFELGIGAGAGTAHVACCHAHDDLVGREVFGVLVGLAGWGEDVPVAQVGFVAFVGDITKQIGP